MTKAELQSKTNELIPLLFLGPEGSFSHSAAQEIVSLFPGRSLQPCESIKAIHKLMLAEPKNYLALFPIENSVGGSVPESLDGLIVHKDLKVILELVVPIKHCLVVFAKETKLVDIEEVRGHFQAFNQCDKFLSENLSKAFKREFPSNSAAAKSLESLPDSLATAAICSSEAAKLFNLNVIAGPINDSDKNYTRFWLWGNPAFLSNVEKNFINQLDQRLTSLAFRIPRDSPGGLLAILEIFASRNINLTKIESRPTKDELCEYTFFIDFLTPDNWSEEREMIMKIFAERCSFVCFLGSYRVLPKMDTRFSG